MDIFITGKHPLYRNSKWHYRSITVPSVSSQISGNSEPLKWASRSMGRYPAPAPSTGLRLCPCKCGSNRKSPPRSATACMSRPNASLHSRKLLVQPSWNRLQRWAASRNESMSVPSPLGRVLREKSLKLFSVFSQNQTACTHDKSASALILPSHFITWCQQLYILFERPCCGLISYHNSSEGESVQPSLFSLINWIVMLKLPLKATRPHFHWKLPNPHAEMGPGIYCLSQFFSGRLKSQPRVGTGDWALGFLLRLLFPVNRAWKEAGWLTLSQLSAGGVIPLSTRLRLFSAPHCQAPRPCISPHWLRRRISMTSILSLNEV